MNAVTTSFPMMSSQVRGSKTRACGRSQLGSTLIEVLVSIVILSIGLLGTAGLLVNSMRTVSEQGNAVAASALARELGERMMANPSVALQTTGNPFLFDSTVAWPSSTVDCKTNFCNQADRTAWDLSEWKKRVLNAGPTGTARIPGVKVKVCLDSLTAGGGTALQWLCTPGTNPVIVVKMAWASRDATGNVENLSGTPVPRVVYIVSPGDKT